MTKMTFKRMSLLVAIVLLISPRNGTQADEQENADKAEKDPARIILAKFGGSVSTKDELSDDYSPIKSIVVSFANSNLTDEDVLFLTRAVDCVFRQERKKEIQRRLMEVSRNNLNAYVTLLLQNPLLTAIRCLSYFCPKLNYRLDLSYTKVTGMGFRKLQEISALTDLDLSSTLVRDEGLRELAFLREQLQNLDLSYTYIRFEDFHEFIKAYADKPIALYLSHTTVVRDELVDDAGMIYCKLKRVNAASLMEELQLLNKVQGLDLSYQAISDGDLNGLKTEEKWKDLKWLDLSHNKATFNCLLSVLDLKQLKGLYLSGNTNCKDLDYTSFLFPSLLFINNMNLSVLDLSGTGITNFGLKLLLLNDDFSNKLTQLNIANTKTILNADVLDIDFDIDLYAYVLEIRLSLADYLEIWPFLNADNRKWLLIRLGIVHCHCFKNLQQLFVNKTGVSDVVVELDAIALLSKLTELDVSDTLVTNVGLEDFLKLLASIYSGVTLELHYGNAPPGARMRLEAIRENAKVSGYRREIRSSSPATR